VRVCVRVDVACAECVRGAGALAVVRAAEVRVAASDEQTAARFAAFIDAEHVARQHFDKLARVHDAVLGSLARRRRDAEQTADALNARERTLNEREAAGERVVVRVSSDARVCSRNTRGRCRAARGSAQRARVGL
jgi:hypothetical protein